MKVEEVEAGGGARGDAALPRAEEEVEEAQGLRGAGETSTATETDQHPTHGYGGGGERD